MYVFIILVYFTAKCFNFVKRRIQKCNHITSEQCMQEKRRLFVYKHNIVHTQYKEIHGRKHRLFQGIQKYMLDNTIKPEPNMKY